MLLRVCEHLTPTSKGKRSVVSLSKKDSRLVLCCECYLDPTGCNVVEVEPKYFRALLKEIELAPTKSVN